MTADSLSDDSFIFSHLRYTHSSMYRALPYSYAMRFCISFSGAFVKFLFCVFVAFLNWCVAFS